MFNRSYSQEYVWRKIYLQPRKGPWRAFLWIHFADGGVVGEGSALPRAAPSSAQVLWLPSPWHHSSSAPPPVSERPLFQTLSVPRAWPSWGPWLSDSLVWVPPVYVNSAVCLPPCGATGRVRLCCSNKCYFTGFLTAALSFQCLSRMELTSLSPGFLLQLCLFSSPWLPVLSGPVPCRPCSEVLGWPIPVLTEPGQVHLLCPSTLGLCSLILWGNLSEQKFSISVQIWSVEGYVWFALHGPRAPMFPRSLLIYLLRFIYCQGRWWETFTWSLKRLSISF